MDRTARCAQVVATLVRTASRWGFTAGHVTIVGLFGLFALCISYVVYRAL